MTWQTSKTSALVRSCGKSWRENSRRGRCRPLGRDAAGPTMLLRQLYLLSRDVAGPGRPGKPNPGRSETFHRLNRTQYRNAIRDLLDLDVDVSAMLPTDDASHGFDNVNVSGLSPTLVEQVSVGVPQDHPPCLGDRLVRADARTVVLPLDYTQDYHVEGLPYGTRGGTEFEHNFPVDGEYEFRFVCPGTVTSRLKGSTRPLSIELAWTVNVAVCSPYAESAGERTGTGAAVHDRRKRGGRGVERPLFVKAGPHTLQRHSSRGRACRRRLGSHSRRTTTAGASPRSFRSLLPVRTTPLRPGKRRAVGAFLYVSHRSLRRSLAVRRRSSRPLPGALTGAR